MKKIFVAFAMLAMGSCMAQEAPSAVKSAFAKNFPGVTVKKWDKEDGKYEANFTREGKTMSATFNVNGTLEETETGIHISQLPAAVVNYVKAKYNGASIKEAAMITDATGAIMYEAEVKGKDLLFDKTGKFLKEEED